MDADVKIFIEKLQKVPFRVKQHKIAEIGAIVFLKCSHITDYLSVVYKSMPTSLRTARKKGMRLSFKSFMYLDRLDKMFLSKKFPNNAGYAFINLRELDSLIKDLIKMIPADEEKLRKIIENQ